MLIEKEKVIAVKVNGQLCCIDCISDADMDNAEAGDFILENEDDKYFIFCDVCTERIL